MVVKLGQPGPKLGTSKSDEVEQFLVWPTADHVVTFATGWRSTDGFVVNGYRSPNKSTASATAA